MGLLSGLSATIARCWRRWTSREELHASPTVISVSNSNSLAQSLEADLDWRFAELATLRIQAVTSVNGSILHQAILRALVAMLYAHYEGFCKFAIRSYMDTLIRMGINRSALKKSIKILSLSEVFARLKADISPGSCWGFFEADLPLALTQAIDFPRNRDGDFVLDGESNLYANLLKNNLANLELPTNFVDSHTIRINSLVGRRNAIAHGKPLIIRQLREYEELAHDVSLLMYELAYALVDALDTQAYLEPSTPPSP